MELICLVLATGEIRKDDVKYRKLPNSITVSANLGVFSDSSLFPHI